MYDWVTIREKDGEVLVMVGTVTIHCPTEKDAWTIKEAIDNHATKVE
jgi:hypothetical protein